MEHHTMKALAPLAKIKPTFIIALLSAVIFLPAQAQNQSRPKLRTVVIDAGHGGKDPGSVSKDKKTYEKNVTLALAKKLGSNITAAYPDVKVIYTRSADQYVTLNERANIANRNNADLFISIHTNSFNTSTPHGFSTHILGQSSDKNRDLFSYNMDVCRRENSVILMEEDYTTTYQGFDPNDPESFIFFNLLQNAYYEQSILFAAEVDAQLIKGPITHSRGISQDPFLVLWRTKMPAVLLEVGFISNSADLKVMRSESGQDAIARRLFEAFRSFKTKYDGSLDFNIAPPETPPAPAPGETAASEETAGTAAAKETPAFGVQIFALSKLLPSDDKSFKGRDVTAIKSGNIYKYVINASSKAEALEIHKKFKKEFPGSFPVSIEGENVKRISL